MPRFRMNVYNGHGDTLDEEGMDFADLDGARRVARIGIRSLLSAEVMEGQIDLRGHLDIVDDAGTVRDTIAFGDVLTIVGP